MLISGNANAATYLSISSGYLTQPKFLLGRVAVRSARLIKAFGLRHQRPNCKFISTTYPAFRHNLR